MLPTQIFTLLIAIVSLNPMTWGQATVNASAAESNCPACSVVSADDDAASPHGDHSPSTKAVAIRPAPSADRNRQIYFKNNLEFSVETGWLPFNIPFVFDFLMGGDYNMTTLRYTLVPTISSVRWHMNNIGGRKFWRGNWDASFGGTVTMIPRGPETRFLGYVMGIRRNMIQPNWKVVPYAEGRVGIGDIDAKGPKGVAWAQGQDLTFLVMLGSGVRYNFNSRYSLQAGVSYMHISNLYLSEPAFGNYGINVYGPTVGFNMQLGNRHRRVAK